MTISDSVASPIGPSHLSTLEVGNRMYVSIDPVCGSLDALREFYFHSVYTPVVKCEILDREFFPRFPLTRVEPRFGANLATAAVLGPLSLFSSLPAFFAARTLDREFTAGEIAEALAAYQSTREYTAPFFSSRGILWPFSTLTA